MLSKVETLKLIKSIGARGRKLDADIQQACIAAVFYSICYGDVTIGQKLLETIHMGARKSAIVAFLEHFGQFEYKGKTVIYRKSVAEFKLEEETHNVADCLEDDELSEEYCDNIKVHWTAFKPEVIKSAYNDIEQVKTFLNRMEKELKAGNVKHPELYDELATAFNTYLEALDEADEQEEEITDNVQDLKVAA